MPELYDDPTPSFLRVLALGFLLFLAFILFFMLTGPAIDSEFDEMERRAREAQSHEVDEP